MSKPSFVNVSSSAKYSLIAVLLFLACAKYAYLPAETGLTAWLNSNDEVSFKTAEVGVKLSPKFPNLYCDFSENNNKADLGARRRPGAGAGDAVWRAGAQQEGMPHCQEKTQTTNA